MSLPAIVPIVEGKSEQGGGIQILLSRILYERRQVSGIEIAQPFRVKRDKVLKEGEIEKAIKYATRDRKEKGSDVKGFLILLDADNDCPVELSASLRERARTATGLPVSVVIAEKAIECWLLGAKESLRGVRGIKTDAVAPVDPESIRGAKGHLSNNMDNNRRYSETRDLPALLGCMDIDLCLERCRSFEKFVCEVERLVQRIKTG